jgi:glycosyltransferase involved in cell wall biosynthesis
VKATEIHKKETNRTKKKNTQQPAPKPVVGFWAGDLNNFQFIDPIIDRLGEHFQVRRFHYDRNDQAALNKALKESDLAWFDWANDAVVPASFNKSVDIPFVCRLHRYEVYGHFPTAINWQRINKLVFVSESVRESFKDRYPEYYGKTGCMVINNGIDLNRFNGDISRPRGKNVAYVGRLHYIKNPSLLLQCFAAIANKDPEHRFHVAGEFSEQVIEEYFWDQVKKLKLEDSLTYYGKIDSVNTWLQDMDYIILPSIIEGEPVSVLEAMATGVKPIVSNFVNAEKVLPAKYLFSTVDECVEMVTGKKFDRAEYRSYVEANNDIEKQIAEVKTLIESLLRESDYYKNSMKTQTADDWDILIPESRFLTPNDLEIFRDKLLTSTSEIIKVKVVYPIVDDHLIGRLEIAAVKKTITTNREETVDCKAICQEEIHLPYNDALEPFIAKQHVEALDKFIVHYKNAKTAKDKTVYARWLSLCLIELGRDRDALDILSDSIQLNADNTDLIYLYLAASLLGDNLDGIQGIADTVEELGDATGYPEFICDVKTKIEELLHRIPAQPLTA